MTKNWIKIGTEKGYIKFSKKDDNEFIEYIHLNKTKNFDNPEEKVRAEVYVELIEEYKYTPNRVKIEEYPPVREGGRPSDLVVYDMEDLPFIVVEVKKEKASNSEIETGIRELFGNANLFGVRWALFD